MVTKDTGLSGWCFVITSFFIFSYMSVLVGMYVTYMQVPRVQAGRESWVLELDGVIGLSDIASTPKH